MSFLARCQCASLGVLFIGRFECSVCVSAVSLRRNRFRLRLSQLLPDLLRNQRALISLFLANRTCWFKESQPLWRLIDLVPLLFYMVSTLLSLPALLLDLSTMRSTHASLLFAFALCPRSEPLDDVFAGVCAVSVLVHEAAFGVHRTALEQPPRHSRVRSFHCFVSVILPLVSCCNDKSGVCVIAKSCCLAVVSLACLSVSVIRRVTDPRSLLQCLRRRMLFFVGVFVLGFSTAAVELTWSIIEGAFKDCLHFSVRACFSSSGSLVFGFHACLNSSGCC
mgnify:CR=1 FL=1